MYKTNDLILNPVRAWANTIERLYNTIPDCSDNTKVCDFNTINGVIQIDSLTVRLKIRSIVELIGEAILGFTKEDVGTHSIRSGGAMAMFLSGVNEIIIQRVGRWLSQAFLEYIRDQVDSFTVGVSEKMLNFETYHHLNDEEFKKSGEITKKSLNDSKEDGSEHVPHTVHYSDVVIDIEPIPASKQASKVMEDGTGSGWQIKL